MKNHDKPSSCVVIAAIAGLLCGWGCAPESDPASTSIIVPEPSILPASARTYDVLDVSIDPDVVSYDVVTPTGEIRRVVYDASGPTVLNAAGEHIFTASPPPDGRVDMQLPINELPYDAVVGFDALGLQRPVPQPTPDQDAVVPGQADRSYLTACSRTKYEWVDESDGCTYGYQLDDCSDDGGGTYMGMYQKGSGDCDGWYCAWELGTGDGCAR